ncbi:hypothetical protein [Peribacillus asahii]|uniref:hypothetical protein n=1 Tax=Peribacillus asahii TaxID=228899 RepID=UPI00207ABACE|nr:hypothetical protein [Peribacillus asahii]USK60913.1 hypothetical protein LIT37_06200 [Peribacillus asahii]
MIDISLAGFLNLVLHHSDEGLFLWLIAEFGPSEGFPFIVPPHPLPKFTLKE